MIEGKCSKGKTVRKDVGWTNKVATVGRVTETQRETSCDIWND